MVALVGRRVQASKCSRGRSCAVVDVLVWPLLSAYRSWALRIYIY